MTYIYHSQPENMKGDKLIPLNQMEFLDPELRNKYLEKYRGREEVLERKIPLLDCLWNDVVQLLPLHPERVFDCQLRLGLINAIPNYKYFKIDISLLDPEKTIVYFKTAPGEENITVKWIKDVNIDELREIPQATRKYYESLVGKGEPVFNYQFIPHIVYMGDIDVSNTQVITIGNSRML